MTCIVSWSIGFPDKDQVIAQLDSDGVFLLSGFGDTKKYVNWDLIPWKEFRDKIITVRFEKGVTPTSISSWFYECRNLRTVENFPDGLLDMSIAFCGCGSLSLLPEIPESITDLDEAFINCTSLTSFPVIPENVIYTCDTFVSCKNLSGHMLLKGALQQHAYMFQDACTAPGSMLTLDYAPGRKAIAEQIVATASESTHIRLGREIE